MNPFELEAQRQKVIELLSQCTSCRQKIVVYKQFFKSILVSPVNDITDTYFIEFYEDFSKCLKEYSPLYINPEFTSDLLNQLRDLKDRFIESYFSGELLQINTEIQKMFKRYTELLNGYVEVFQPNQKVSFPVLEKQNISSISFGMLEFLTIKISKSILYDKFIIIPSENSIESRLSEQVKNSWQVALNFTKRQTRRINIFHEVIICFDNRNGEYEGNSLGIALTIGFVEALLRYYNTPFLVNINENISSTGGMDINGKILSVSESIIKKKIEIVFYSNTSLFIVPSSDLIKAEKALNEVKQNFPKRELRLIGISDLDDLLNRRNLITIKKQNPLIRISRLARDNWAISLALIIILLFVSYTILFNPVR